MNLLLALVIIIPIFSALLIAFTGRSFPSFAGWIAAGAVLLSFAFAVPVALQGIAGNATELHLWNFFFTKTLSIDVAFRVDELSGIMLFVVLGVGGLIHFYSIEYMKHDRSRGRFFALLNAFISFMLILILGNNLLMLFAGWEGVGFASYALIGFWYERQAPAKAGIKAFITNRVGDFGFMIGIFLLCWLTGSGSLAEINARCVELKNVTVNIGGMPFGYLELVALMLFLGACGKSAQFPLHAWLPDAMEGPTPVSALIHAATMVTAGIYMVCRLDGVFAAADTVREIMLLGALVTALGAAIVACAQTDLKRILAYSTISQLGYMMAGAAVMAKGTAIFHLATHAVFKALLFLSAGSVMHALSDKLDIREMGGLIRKIPVTGIVMIVGALGLAGVPLFAGYYSKEMIIGAVAADNYFAAALLIVGAAITAFYSARMIMLVFFGESRFDDETSKHCHESNWIMILPLIILAVGTLIVGHLHVSEILGHIEEENLSWVFYSALASVIFGGGFGIYYYRTHLSHSTPWKEFIKTGFGWDAAVDRVLIQPITELAKWVRDYLDKAGIDSLAHGMAHTAGAFGETMRTLQSGSIGTYLGYAVFGLAILLWFIVP
ncbi:MAG: NADH-quinone oxidoreductase subunit L [Candidatus Hydrogenedentes bacterium CG1_02_42_14]|nr:MAG: NADH-quinone oxidoreductase subunit L [Candidatus Hydrogenedentes bacterium CG1_02_42_14]